MATISKKNMADRAAQAVRHTPNITDRLQHAQDLALAHPVDESVPRTSAQTVAQVDYKVGQVYSVPISRVRENPWNAREFYTTDEVDAMAVSLTEHGQEVPALGYVADQAVGFITLIDGQKRLRGAKAAGILELRIDLCVAPIDAKSMYLTSRRINLERSSQTALDDAVRFQHLLSSGVFAKQEDLAAAIGKSQETVSRITKLTVIPEKIMRRMRDHPLLTGINAAYAISQIFTAGKFKDDPDGSENLASLIIDESLKKEISANQVMQLVASRLAGPIHRNRNTKRDVVYAGKKGVFKTNEEKGLLEFSISGLSAEQVEELRRKIESTLQAA